MSEAASKIADAAGPDDDQTVPSTFHIDNDDGSEVCGGDAGKEVCEWEEERETDRDRGKGIGEKVGGVCACVWVSCIFGLFCSFAVCSL